MNLHYSMTLPEVVDPGGDRTWSSVQARLAAIDWNFEHRSRVPAVETIHPYPAKFIGDIPPKYIPAELFDKRAVEKNQVLFHDVAFIVVKPHFKSGRKERSAIVVAELTDFPVFYPQDSITHTETALATTTKAGSKMALKVVAIFGNDTMTIFEVRV